MIGMMRFTPEASVRWYFPSRSMIIVCACCTTRMPFATIEIATRAIATGTMYAPMSISALLVHIQSRALHPDDHHSGPGLERRVHQGCRAPILTLDQDPAFPGGGVDALGDDPHLAGEGIHVRPELGSPRVEQPEQERTDPHEGKEGPRGERESRDEGPRRHQGGDAGGEAADRDREEPEPRRDHFGHEEEQGGDEPDLPLVHRVKLA